MKRKLVMMISIGTLAIGVSVPNAMATSRSSLGSARGPNSASKSLKKAQAKKSVSGTAVPQPHTILNGATNNY